MVDRYIRDSIHSFVSFPRDGLINQLIDTEEFQRMRDIRQLGLSYFTYPNAVHSRFSHSLGTYWLAKRVGNILLSKEEEKRIFEIAALLHDIGHGPFSHALDKMIVPNVSHESISVDLIESKKHRISEILIENGINPMDISRVLSGDIRPKYLHKLISSQLDVDRFDYLLRDSSMSGNPHGGFDLDRIIQTIRISDNHEIYVVKGGWDAVEHYLNCRYQMYKQVYYHHSTLAAEELIKKIINRYRFLYNNEENKCEKRYIPLMTKSLNLEDFISLTDTDILNLVKMSKDSKDPILVDLNKRYLKRELFKNIRLPGEMASELLKLNDDIIQMIRKRGFDETYYFSTVTLQSREAYLPYTPDPKDPEDWIYSNKECSRDISSEITSINSIVTKSEILLFLPDNECKTDVEKILSPTP